MRMLNATVIIAFSALTFVSTAQAATWNEVEDAGEFLFTANLPGGAGSLTRIDGSLIDLGRDVDDVDLYRIYINNPAVFSVVTAASLNEDNDAQLYLFNTAGEMVIWDDDGAEDDDDLQPELFAGELSGQAPGFYYLAYHLFGTKPTLSAGSLGRLIGWARNPEPFQTGQYSLFLTGATLSPPKLIDAGPDQTVTFPGPASLTGYLRGSIPTSGYFGWAMAYGPGTVTLAAPALASTTATFSAPGTYTLMFWVYEGGYYPATDEVVIIVQP